MKGFVAVAVVPTENLEIPSGDLQEIFKRIFESEGDVRSDIRDKETNQHIHNVLAGG